MDWNRIGLYVVFWERPAKKLSKSHETPVNYENTEFSITVDIFCIVNAFHRDSEIYCKNYNNKNGTKNQ